MSTKAERERLKKDDDMKGVVNFLKNSGEYFYWFIPGNVPSSKNNKVPMPIYVGPRGTKQRRIISCSVQNSDSTKKYVTEKKELYHKFGCEFRELFNEQKQLKIGFFFINKTKAQFDYINKAQMVQDMMVKHGWISDDNADVMRPVFPEINGHIYLSDTKYCGVIILIKKELCYENA